MTTVTIVDSLENRPLSQITGAGKDCNPAYFDLITRRLVVLQFHWRTPRGKPQILRDKPRATEPYCNGYIYLQSYGQSPTVRKAVKKVCIHGLVKELSGPRPVFRVTYVILQTTHLEFRGTTTVSLKTQPTFQITEGSGQGLQFHLLQLHLGASISST